jgi:hypothetical protein
MDSSSSNFASPRVKDKVNLYFFDKYFLFPAMVTCCVVVLSFFFFLMHPFPGYVDLSVIVCSGQHIRACKYILDLYPRKGPLYVLINKARLVMGKKTLIQSFSFSTASSSSPYTHLGFLFPNFCLHG